MFTGIVEEVGTVTAIESSQENLTFTIQCDFYHELKIDQSVAHNGVCLTVIAIDPEQSTYQVTAVRETLLKTNLRSLKRGEGINLERAMLMNGRMDGHIVQGHVDGTTVCKSIEEADGSWVFTFELDPAEAGLMIEKGSITINGVSLTLFDVKENSFSVTIIPYTFQHTTFHQLKAGDKVNLEFDVIGKYVSKQLSVAKKLL